MRAGCSVCDSIEVVVVLVCGSLCGCGMCAGASYRCAKEVGDEWMIRLITLLIMEAKTILTRRSRSLRPGILDSVLVIRCSISLVLDRRTERRKEKTSRKPV